MAKCFLVEVLHLYIILENTFSILIQDKRIFLWIFGSNSNIFYQEPKAPYTDLQCSSTHILLYSCVYGFHFHRALKMCLKPVTMAYFLICCSLYQNVGMKKILHSCLLTETYKFKKTYTKKTITSKVLTRSKRELVWSKDTKVCKECKGH